MKILVTGGLGFIGTHLINELFTMYQIDRESSDTEIHVVDNLSNSAYTTERQKFFTVANIGFYECDVVDFIPPNGTKYSYIYHLASPVGPAGVLKYSGRLAENILNGSLHIARLALKHDAGLLVASTSEVYGKSDSTTGRQSEDLPKTVPSNITVRLEYGVAKLMAEIALLNLAKVEPLKVNFIRPFNIVGPYQKAEVGFVLPRFVDAALKNLPLTVFGDGRQLRTFTAVQDIVDAMMLISMSPRFGKIYNVGNPENVCSVKELAEKVIKYAKSDSEIKFVDPKTIYGPLYEEAWNKIPDITKIQQDLAWNPLFTLDEIISNYIEFAKQGNTEF